MNTPALLATTAVVLCLTACASPPPQSNAAVAAMRARLAQSEQNQAERQAAPTALREAEQSLAAADQAARNEDSGEMNHQLYLADRALHTADATTRAATARSQMANLSQQRDQLALAAREKELEAYKSRQSDQGTIISLNDLPFTTGKATLLPGAAARLQPLVSYLQTHPDRQVIVEGNTDSTGSREANLALSQERADAVRDYLLSAGVTPDRVVARGMGESLPVASNDTPAGRQQNRRVDVVIAPPGPSTASLPPPPPPTGMAPPPPPPPGGATP